MYSTSILGNGVKRFSETGVSYICDDMGVVPICSKHGAVAFQPFALHQYLHVNKLSLHTVHMVNYLIVGCCKTIPIISYFNYLFDIHAINNNLIAVFENHKCCESECNACFVHLFINYYKYLIAFVCCSSNNNITYLCLPNT